MPSLILLFCLFSPFAVEAGEKAPGRESHELKEIVVTATRSQTPRQEIAANITVITREDIESLPVSNMAELLQYVPGIYVEFNGGLGSQATARIQGSDFRHVAVYVDGVPLNQLANPSTDLSYLPTNWIERVEIYKGAASSAWGSSLGGVINIITREPDPEKPVRAGIATSYGNFRTSKNRLSVSGTVDRYGYLLNLTHDVSDGFIDYTKYRQDAVYAKANWEAGDRSRLNLVYSYYEGRNEDPVLNFPDFWDDLYRERTYQRLIFETAPSDDMLLSIEGRYHRFYNLIEDVFPDHRESFSDYRESSWGASGHMTWDTSEANTLHIGFDQDWGEYDWKRYQRKFETRNGALYANDTFTHGAFSFNAGLRVDDNRDFGSEVSPSAGAVYRLSGEKLLVRGQVARGFSAPPASMVDDPTYGNPDLHPETGISYQLGGQARPLPFLRIELNVFRADIKDLIRFNQSTQKFENIDRVTRKGVEGDIRLTFDSGFAMTYGGSFIDVKDDTTGQVIKDIPRALQNLSVSYSRPGMTHTLVGKYIYHTSSFPETRDRKFVFDYHLKVRLPLAKRYGKLVLTGSVYNLTNSNYLYREVYPQPGRWFEGGVSFEF